MYLPHYTASRDIAVTKLNLTHTTDSNCIVLILNYSMQQSPSWETNRFSASQEIPSILWNRRFITAFTTARQLSLSWARSIQWMTAQATSWRSVFILSSHLRLVLQNCLFLSGLRTRTPVHHTFYMSRSTQSRSPNKVWWGTEIIMLFLCSFLHSPVTPSLLVPNFLLKMLFSITLSLCSSINVSDQVS